MAVLLRMTLVGGLFIFVSSARCSGDRQCCPGFKWDSTSGKCVECKVGYMGLDCKQKCPYPSYGLQCQTLCDCDESLCNYIYGCDLSTTDSIHLDEKSLTISYNTVETEGAETFVNESLHTTDRQYYLPHTFKVFILSTLVITLLLLVFCLSYFAFQIMSKLKRRKRDFKVKNRTSTQYDSVQQINDEHVERSYDQPKTITRYEGASLITILHDEEASTYVMKLTTEPLKGTKCTKDSGGHLTTFTNEGDYIEPIETIGTHCKQFVKRFSV